MGHCVRKGEVGVEAKDLKLDNVRNAEPLEKV